MSIGKGHLFSIEWLLGMFSEKLSEMIIFVIMFGDDSGAYITHFFNTNSKEVSEINY